MTDGDDPTAVADRLAEHAIELETADPGAALADLEPLRAAFRDRRVVGLGEATHGTREFFQLKHRLIRFLVEELGFRLFGMEANFSETLAINDYVVHGQGDPVEALEGIYFWTWNTEEVLALIEYLREFNDGRPKDDRVRFYGFDVQYARGPADAVESYLEEVDPDYLSEVREDLSTLRDGINPYGRDDEAFDRRLDATESVVAALPDRLERRREEYVATAGEREHELAARHARVMERAHELRRATYGADDLSGWRIRERAMAETVSWILEYEDRDRIVLWAHNGHVARGDKHIDGDEKTMGQFLHETFDDDYYPLGFEFGRGSLQALPGEESDESGLQEWTVETVPEGSLTEAFDRSGVSIAALDFECAREDPVLDRWLAREHERRSIGALFEEDDLQTVEDPPAERFDGLVFVAETTRARPIDRDEGNGDGGSGPEDGDAETAE